MDRMQDKREARKQVQRRTLSATVAAGVVPTRLSGGDISKVIRLLNNPDSIIREGAVKSLSRIGSKEAKSAIIGYMNDPDPRVRAAVYKGMGKMRMYNEKEHILEALKDEDERVRCAAAAGLGMLGDKSGLKIALKLARPSHPLKWEALRSINAITRKNFPVNFDGLSSAIRWVQHNKKTLMKS